MTGYLYDPKTVERWEELPASTYLRDLNRHMETQISYWKNRAKSAERRMLEHDCQEEK